MIICVAGLAILWLLNFFLVVVLPIVVALLLAALVSPVVNWQERLGVPRKVAAMLVVLGGIATIVLMVAFVSNQVAAGVGDLSKQVGDGDLTQIRDWLRTGPLHVTDSQISDGLDRAQEQLSALGEDAVGKLTEVGTAVGHEVPTPDENMKGKIVDEVEKGYYLNDKIIRFAKVVVGK